MGRIHPDFYKMFGCLRMNELWEAFNRKTNKTEKEGRDGGREEERHKKGRREGEKEKEGRTEKEERREGRKGRGKDALSLEDLLLI